MPKDKQPDAVDRDDYNKVVELQNSTKAENEKLKKELEDVKKTNEEEEKKKEIEKTANEKIEEQKKEWEKEKIEKDKQIEELKAKTKSDDTVVRKGLAKDKPPEKTEVTHEQVVNEIKNELGELPEKNPNNFANKWARYGFYKNPASRQFSDEQFGKALSLHAGLIRNDDAPLNPNQKDFGKKESNDIIVPRSYGTDERPK